MLLHYTCIVPAKELKIFPLCIILNMFLQRIHLKKERRKEVSGFLFFGKDINY